MDATTRSALLQILTAHIADTSRKNLTPAELDAGYASLTAEEKFALLNSINNGGEDARNIIDIKLNTPLREAAAIRAQAYIDANSIPLDVISGLIIKGK